MIHATIPILPSADLQRTANFYNCLGFHGQRRYPDYLILQRDGQELHFFLHAEPHPGDHSHFACYIRATDIDGLFAEIQAAGLAANPPSDRPWGQREMELIDPDGTLLRIGQPVG